MKKTRPLLTVSAVILINDSGEILLAQRPEGKALAGLWEFPGGKIESDETPEDALVRELEEELNIQIALQDLHVFTFASHSYDDMHLLMPLFTCRNWQGEIQPQEGQTIAWVPLDELEQYDMPPADTPLIPLLQNGVSL